ncbi:hypothetical protein [Methanoculleus sp.]|uniref:hypothetical protein n=1 Tax=Methanoculleus sp. TaxID=90427 RepID=UPI002FC7F6B2
MAMLIGSCIPVASRNPVRFQHLPVQWTVVAIAIGGTTAGTAGVRAPKVRSGADGECDGRNARSSTTVRWEGARPLPCLYPF